jgi:hypothetical protein
MRLTVVLVSAVLVFVVSVAAGGDLLKASYLVRKKIYPVTPKYFAVLIALAVAALVLSVIVFHNWWYSSLATLVIILVAGSAILGSRTKMSG